MMSSTVRTRGPQVHREPNGGQRTPKDWIGTNCRGRVPEALLVLADKAQSLIFTRFRFGTFPKKGC